MNASFGTVYLVGAGPGAPDLITIRGLQLLRRADTVVYDRLIAEELLAETKPGAELIDAGKEPGRHRYAQPWINALLIDRARHGRTVVRLKGGDPFVFGRGHEELTACRRTGVPCVVVPGVSSAFAAPAAAGIPVTHRNLARTVAVVTGQIARDLGGSNHTDAGATSGAGLDFKALAAMDTIVILMGRSNLAELAAGLIAAGRDPDTPAACVERATTAEQRATRATLASLVEAVEKDGLRAPVVTVIGQVASLSGQADALPLAVQTAVVERRGRRRAFPRAG